MGKNKFDAKEFANYIHSLSSKELIAERIEIYDKMLTLGVPTDYISKVECIAMELLLRNFK